MSNKNDDLEPRLAVVETKIENTEIQQTDMKAHIKEIYGISQDVKTKLLQLNGSLPRIEKGLVSIEDKLDLVTVRVEVTSNKVKILWGIVGTLSGILAATGIGYLFKLVFGF